MTTTPAPGTRVRIALRHPEDEGFARRLIDGREGVVTTDSLAPGDPRVVVALANSDTRAIVDPSELDVLAVPHDHTADNATTKWVARTDLCDSEIGPAVEPRTYVTVCWGADFIATSYPGHLGDAEAIARAVAEDRDAYMAALAVAATERDRARADALRSEGA